MSPNQKNLERAFRIYLFVLMSVYGWGKIVSHQFYLHGHLPADIAKKTLLEATAHDMAWVFFGYSNGYLWFIGLAEAISAILILFEKTRLLGAMVMVPILLNVIVVDICFDVTPGPMMSAILYMLMLVTIIYLNRNTMWDILQRLMKGSEQSVILFQQNRNRNIATILAIIALFAIIETSVFLLVHFYIRGSHEVWFFTLPPGHPD